MAATLTHRDWYPADERELARLRALGLPRPEIARRMGRTFDSVKAQIVKHPGRYPKRRRADEYYEALQVTHTIAGVAGAMGVAPNTVHRAKWKLRRAGLEVGPAKRNRRMEEN